MTSDETCSGAGQCRKDAAIRNAQREALRSMGVKVVGNGEWSGGAAPSEPLRQSLVGVVGVGHAERAPDIRGIYSDSSRAATNILGGVQSQARTFTREEVLTVLRARRAMMDTTASSDVARYNELADLIRIFERME